MSFNLLTIGPKGTLEICAEAITIKSFKDIWDRDKSTYKEQACNELAFIYWMYKWDSMFFKGYPDEIERQTEVIEYIFKSKYKPDKLVQIASKEYQELQLKSYPSLSDLSVARKTLGSLKQFLNDLDPNERTNAGGLVLKPSDIYIAIAKMGEALSSVDKIEKKVKEELEITDTRIKGGGKAGSFEDEDSLEYLKK